MGLDMYLRANKYVGGGWSHVRSDLIQQEDGTRIAVPKVPKPREAKEFDGIIRSLGLGTFERWSERYPKSQSINVSITVAYWRKANAVHQWFVTNVQNGVDNCNPHELDTSDLQKLLDICRRILQTVDKGEGVTESSIFGEYTNYPNATLDRELARELLPPQGGFFFGSTELGIDYILDLEETEKQLSAILGDKRFSDGAWRFEYQSSW